MGKPQSVNEILDQFLVDEDQTAMNEKMVQLGGSYARGAYELLRVINQFDVVPDLNYSVKGGVNWWLLLIDLLEVLIVHLRGYVRKSKRKIDSERQ